MTRGTDGLLFCFLLAACDASPSSAASHHRQDEHEAGHEEEGRVVLDPHVVERNGIADEPVQRHLLIGALEVPAEVQVNPDRQAHVSPLVAGRIAQTQVDLGQEVQRGEVLATVRSVELGRIRGALTAARARQKAADAERARYATLVGEGISASKNALEADARADVAAADVASLRAALDAVGSRGGGGATLALSSPIDGTVVRRHASPGEYVSETSDPFVVADLSTVWVMGRVYEQEIAQVSEGMPAEVTFIAHPGEVWTGTVDYVAPTLDEHTRTLPVRVVLPNSDGTLRPGMFGTLALQGEAAGDEAGRVLAVPSAAISSLGDRTVVFVRGEHEGTFEARDVIVGATASGFVEIREGLAEGERVVTHGAFVLKSVVMRDAIGEGHAH